MREERFEALYRDHHEFIVGLLSQLCGSRELAEDLAQEVFLNIYRYIDTYSEDRGPFRPWAVTIARNVYYRFLRRRQAEDHSVDAGSAAEVPSHAESVEGRLLREQILRSVDSLPEPERSVILFKQVQQKSLSETARLLGVSERTVSRKLQAALLLLDEKLKSQGISIDR